MKLTQISIFLENKKGRLHEVCALLGRNNVNIRALNIAESDDFGILRIVVDRPDAALKALKENGFVANLTDIVAIEVDDRPGGLADVLKVISTGNMNIEYMYGFLSTRKGKAVIVFRFDDADRAIEVLKAGMISIITQETVQDF